MASGHNEHRNSGGPLTVSVPLSSSQLIMQIHQQWCMPGALLGAENSHKSKIFVPVCEIRIDKELLNY
jgi:hypothetical protein